MFLIRHRGDDMHIIIRGKTKYGKTRGEQEENLRKDGMQTIDDGQLDKLKFIEKKLGMKNGFMGQADIDKLK